MLLDIQIDIIKQKTGGGAKRLIKEMEISYDRMH